MLTIEISGKDLYDEKLGKFVNMKSCKIDLEHSLLSISKWESKWKEPFLSSKDFTRVKFQDYVRCMSIGKIDSEILLGLSNENFNEIRKYIDDPMTATTFSKKITKPNREIITSEILYYRMIVNNIPLECQKWHLNRLLTLIRVCDEKNAPSRKMSKHELTSRNAALNAARRKQLNTKG